MATAQDRTDWRKLIYAPPTATKPKFKPNPPLINSRVVKKFKGKWYGGKITALAEEADTLRPIWRVQYDDGDCGDYYEHEISMDLMDASDPVEMSLATLHEPTSIINRTVWKTFDKILHHGKITNYDYDQKTGDTIWRIEYGDLDCEDLNWQEVYPILVDTKICYIPPPHPYHPANMHAQGARVAPETMCI
jgi:hypothetical protein